MIIQKTSVIISLLSVIFITGCDSKRLNKNENALIKIEITYLKGFIETPFRYECDSFPDAIHKNKDRFVDTVITDKIVLDQIQNELSRIKVNDTLVSPDIRIKCRFIYHDNTEDIICLGDWFGTAFNGQPCMDNYNLAFLIKFNTGYYNYFYKEEFLNYFNELKDSIKFDQAIKQLEIFKRKRNKQTWIDTSMVKIGQ